MRAGWECLVLGVLAGCASDGTRGGSHPADSTGHLIDPSWPEDCAGLPDDTLAECAEAHFWRALRVDLDGRFSTWEMLGARATDLADRGAEPTMRSRVHFQRGQLAMALGIEQGRQDVLPSVMDDLEAAMALDPSNPILPTWKDAMDIAVAHIFQDDVALAAALESAWENVELMPMGNILSISGTTIGLPLSTGAPQHTTELLDQWVCEGVAWCDDNLWTAPWARPGLAYHFGEAYARVGRYDDAQRWFDASLAAPDADLWPWRYMADEAAADVEAYATRFTELGEDGSAFDVVYANSEVGCVFCHGAAGSRWDD